MVLLAFGDGHLFSPTPHPSPILDAKLSFGKDLSSNLFLVSSDANDFTLLHRLL